MRSIRDTHLNAGFTFIILPIIIRLSFTANDIDCCFMAILSWGKPAGRRNMRKLWSNLKPNHAMWFHEQIADLREQTDYPRRRKERKICRASERGVESQLRSGAQRAYRDQEDATDPMVAPQDCHVHQSVRVLELQNSDLWLRPTDREESFKNYRSRKGEKWKAKENEAEEFKKQKLQKNSDGQSYANWQPSSWSWHQPATWASSSWEQWRSGGTRERSDWQPSADWRSSDQTRERSDWRSSGSWQSPFSWQ